uniref:Equilibrative nucleoside transporter 1 n=1 Tax=Timema genevievae TaxID=629358 RepID=A0A7R9PIT0_TIMGE|nr:unnamed protein product [Timema genevievae]
MDYSVNTRPLLQRSDSESDLEEEEEEEGGLDQTEHPVVITKDPGHLFKIREPKDRYHLAYIIFYLLGMTTLLPWNFFITADDYWMYKLRNVTANVSHRESGRTELQAGFTAYLSVASTIPNTLFLILNSLLSHRISLQLRMVGSLSIIVILFILTTALVEVDTDSWQQIFFITTLITVVLLNIASAVLQGGLFGLVGKFSPRYITAVVSGQALGGIFAALAEIVSLCLGAAPTTSAFVYFMVANAMLLMALTAYLILARAVFFRYHLMEKCEVNTLHYEPCVIQTSSSSLTTRNISYTRILAKMWPYGLSVWMTFFITLAMYPALTVLVNSMAQGNKKPWNDIYFVPVVGYLIFSTCDYLGRILAGLLQWGWLVILLAVCRVVFVPLLMLCNARPRHHMPVLIDSDLYYILIIVVFALSNGYLANLTLICVPR